MPLQQSAPARAGMRWLCYDVNMINPLLLRVILAVVGILAVVITRLFSDSPLEIGEVVQVLGAVLAGISLPAPGHNGNGTVK